MPVNPFSRGMGASPMQLAAPAAAFEERLKPRPHGRGAHATFVLVLLASLIALAGCDDAASSPSSSSTSQATRSAGGPPKYPYTVVTTVGMVTDIVRQVAGEKATVTGLIGEGVDPHL